MIEIDANYINIKNNHIYIITAIYQQNTTKPLFYKYGKIDTIMKDIAKIIKNIQPTTPNDYGFTIKLIGCFDNIAQAETMYDNLMIVAPPIVSVDDVASFARRGRPTQGVTCVETGETWESVADAARSAGIRPQRMVAHLNGYNGYRTIGGRTYRRISA